MWGLSGLGILSALTLTATGCATRGRATERQVIVLGFDGMDYTLTRELMARGVMPGFSRLAAAGSFGPLETTIPPQSPVAWSTFITGLDPDGHGIFDFIHRDPKTLTPYLSTTRTEEGGRTLKLGKWQFPLTGGRVELLRRGRPFWEELEARGIDTTIIRMPANFPPSGSATRELSGMGTPDIRGTYGMFSFYTSEPFAFAGRSISGGTVYPVSAAGRVVRAKLYGPDNPFLREPEKVAADFTVYLDGRNPVAKIVVSDAERILKEGEWSDWVPVAFDLMPLQTLRGICRFYLKQVRPDFQLYVSPINLDPLEPAMPISTPASYAADLARDTGLFYTQGIPEDTKSLTEGVLSPDEFLEQARIVRDESRRHYQYVLERFQGGLLFYYFGNVDQIAHMMWRARDPEHPAYDPAVDERYKTVVEELYVWLDRLVLDTLEQVGDRAALIVLSDHGFTSWRRAFHLNSWLRDQGYLALVDPLRKDDPGLFGNVDWSRTRAYGVGLNGLYVNLRGREQVGIVALEERRPLVDEISRKLLAAIDPATGGRAVTKVYRRDPADPQSDIGPDLIVGYARGMRGSNESALGGVPAEVIVDNRDAWSGDHCMDHEEVPGILLTSRPLKKSARSLKALGAAIVAEFAQP